MKKFKLVLAALTLASSLAFAEYADVPSSHWANEAVVNLQSKGLLAPSVGNATVFNGDGVFSRYEVASMLYLSLNNTNENLDKKASKEDLEAMQLLVKNFSPELTKMGAKVSDLEKKLADLEKKGGAADLEKKLVKRMDSMDDRYGKVKITGNFTAIQEIGMKENTPGMQPLDLTGDLAIIGNVSKNVSVMTRLGVERGVTPEVEAIELKAKTDVFNISFFSDKDKDAESLLSFSNTFGLFVGNTVAPKEGILFNGTYKNKLTNTNYTGLLFKTASGDFYGLQVKNDIEPLKAAGVDAFVRGTYSEKILKYQYDNANDPDNGKAFYSVDGYVKLKPLQNLDVTAAAEYGTRRGPGVENIESDETTGLVGSLDALYAYGNANLKLTDKVKLYATGGYYNAGEYFDIAGIGNNQKTVFSESGIVKLEAGKTSYLAKAGAVIGFAEVSGQMASHAANVKAAMAKQHITAEAKLNIANMYKPSVVYTLEVDERLGTDLADSAKRDDVKWFKDGELVAEEGTRTIAINNKFTPSSAIDLNANLTLKDDLDVENNTDTGNKMEIYADAGVNVTSNIFTKGAARYTIEGTDLDAAHENTKLTKFESGFGAEFKGLKAGERDLGKVNVGARYSFEDKKGLAADNTDKKSDKGNSSIFAAHELSFGKLLVKYGTAYKVEAKYLEAENKVKDEDEDNNFVYAFGIEYDFGSSVILSASYGDPKLVKSDSNYMLDMTDYAADKQDLAKIEITAKF